MSEREKSEMRETGEMEAPAMAAATLGAGTEPVEAPAAAPAAAQVAAPRVAPRPAVAKPQDPFLRAENEDDDGYDPYSDRRPAPEPLFERDPWA